MGAIMIEKEIKTILEIFMDDVPDRILLRKLSDLIEIKGFGQEYRACMTSEGLKYGDEDYFADDSVKITIQPPANRSDVMVIVTNQVFYDALKNRVERFISQNPSDREKALQYMEIIKNNLSVN